MNKAVCVHFISIEEDRIKCKLGHQATLDSFYCFKNCPDYKPGKKIQGADEKEKQILDLLSRGGEWSLDEISKITKLKKKK